MKVSEQEWKRHLQIEEVLVEFRLEEISLGQAAKKMEEVFKRFTQPPVQSGEEGAPK